MKLASSTLSLALPIALTFLSSFATAGPNLTPSVRNFTIQQGYIGELTEVQDGCIPNGTHNLLRFDFLSENIGDEAFIAGIPLARPDMFYYHLSHHHFHMREFNQYRLVATTGNLIIPSTKPGFCLSDSEQVLQNSTVTSGYYPSTCPDNATMGISAGWADIYFSDITCQYLVIDDVPDGDYVLVVVTNAARKIPEDTYADNTASVGLHIEGATVSQINVPTGFSYSFPVPTTTMSASGGSSSTTGTGKTTGTAAGQAGSTMLASGAMKGREGMGGMVGLVIALTLMFWIS